jgi:hypothetical protein
MWLKGPTEILDHYKKTEAVATEEAAKKVIYWAI